MHIPARLVFAAPVVLALAACGDTTEVEDRVVETAEAEAPIDVDLPTVPVEYPEVPLNPRDTLEYAGTYELHAANGDVSTITLSDADTYVWRAPDGAETSGSFTWGPENDRILIERNGETQAYAVAADVLYRLPSADAVADGERSEETTWRRSDSTPADGNQADLPDE